MYITVVLLTHQSIMILQARAELGMGTGNKVYTNESVGWKSGKIAPNCKHYLQ